MNLNNVEKLLEIVPQTYGEAIVIYPWINCEPREWDNRTTIENTIYLLEAIAIYLVKV